MAYGIDKNDMLTDLREHKVARVEIGYNGQGDEGWIDTIIAYANADDKFGRVELADGLGRQVEEFAYDVLERHAPGWEINEGSSGKIEIDVATGKVATQHFANYVDSNEFNWED